MKSESLVTDHAIALARVILDIVLPCIRKSQRKAAFGMFVEAAKGMLTSYEQKAARMERRVGPSKN